MFSLLTFFTKTMDNGFSAVNNVFSLSFYCRVKTGPLKSTNKTNFISPVLYYIETKRMHCMYKHF